MAEKQMNLQFKGKGLSQITQSTTGCPTTQTLKDPFAKRPVTAKMPKKPRGTKKPFSTSKSVEEKKLFQQDKPGNKEEEKKAPLKKPISKVDNDEFEQEKKMATSVSQQKTISPSGDQFPAFETWLDELGDWKTPLQKFIKSKMMKDIYVYVKKEYESDTIIYPPRHQIFNAYRMTPWQKVKVVIVGQDPYIKHNQAMGLSFSVPKDQKVVPPSLKTIYSAIEQDKKNNFKRPSPLHGDLSSWAEQGVFMLNASLTVKQGRSNSHKGCGWLEFTKATMQTISKEKEGIIFMLWGKFAQQKGKGIDRKKHHVLEFQHPSPLAGPGFSKCNHFSEVNQILKASKRETINWNLK